MLNFALTLADIHAYTYLHTQSLTHTFADAFLHFDNNNKDDDDVTTKAAASQPILLLFTYGDFCRSEMLVCI